MRICEVLSAFALASAPTGQSVISTVAEVGMISTRIRAPDTEQLAEFYQSAFSMQEVQRIVIGSGVEIMLSFGAAGEARQECAPPATVAAK